MHRDLSCASAKVEAGESHEWSTLKCGYLMHNKGLCESCLGSFQKQVADYIDTCQFAYRRNRGVENAILHVLNIIYFHLEKPETCIRLMFYDFL